MKDLRKTGIKVYHKYSKTPYIYPDKMNVTGIVASDWHIGDKYAPLPNQPCTKEGQTIMSSDFQRKIKKKLVEDLKQIGKVEVLIIDGDVIEGKQVKTGGIPVNDTDTDTQVNWAFQFYEETFYKYNNPDYVIITMGTPYHSSVGIGGNLDYQFADKVSRISNVLFGAPNMSIYMGKGNQLWDIRHRISIANVNKGMPNEKTFRMFYRECEENGVPSPDVIVRAHNHSRAKAPFNTSSGLIAKYFIESACLKGSDVYGEMLRYPSNPVLGVISFSQVGRDLYGSLHGIDARVRDVEVL